MIKFINEIALITAVSVLKMFFDNEKEVVRGLAKIISLSVGEKSPSGPISKVKSFLLLMSLDLILYEEFTSANNMLVSFFYYQ